jgi:hypothetical protein
MFEGDYTVTGGTGRFDGATGSGFIAGAAFNTGPNTGVGSLGRLAAIAPAKVIPKVTSKNAIEAMTARSAARFVARCCADAESKTP